MRHGAGVQGFSYLPGWGEKNFQVLGKTFEAIQLLASSSDVITRKDAFVAVGGLLEKVADVKLKSLAAAALSMLCEVIGPQFVCVQVHKKAAAHKNPKVDHQLFCSQTTHRYATPCPKGHVPRMLVGLQCARAQDKLPRASLMILNVKPCKLMSVAFQAMYPQVQVLLPNITVKVGYALLAMSLSALSYATGFERDAAVDGGGH